MGGNANVLGIIYNFFRLSAIFYLITGKNMSVFWSAKMMVIYIYILSIVYIQRRGSIKYTFFRQLTDHSSFFAPLNTFVYLFSKVPSTPFLDNSLFPETQRLELNWESIRDEGLGLLTQGVVKASNKNDDAGFQSFFKNGWTRFYLKWYGDYHPSAKKCCPSTIALLQQIPSIKAAMFAYLPPGARLVRHRDPYAGSLRYHLGLSTPNSESCKIIVDNTARYWRDGQGFIFDETYIHYAENQTEQGRLILLCDIERPMRFIIPTYINRFLALFLLKAARSPNDREDSTGLINRIFKLIYPIRTVGKKIKKMSKPSYYFLKYILLSLLLFYLFRHI